MDPAKYGQFWVRDAPEDPRDFFYTSDAGEDYNMSQAVRNMLAKIDACIGRYDDECFL